jgi:hypothetical protein
MSSFQQFLSVKTVIVNEIITKLTEQSLMTDELSTFFDTHIAEVVEVEKKEKVKIRKEKSAAKEKRPATPHQLNVNKCLAILKERYAHVAHRYRMGAAQFMVAYLRDKEIIEGDDHEHDSVLHAIEKMNEKHGNIFTDAPVTQEDHDPSPTPEDEKKKKADNVASKEAKAEAKALKDQVKASKKNKTTIIVQEEEPVEEQSSDNM